MARDCKVSVKCSEYASDKHLAALHVDREKEPREPDQAHGGEQMNESQQTKDRKANQEQHEKSASTTRNMYGDLWRQIRRKVMLQDMYR